MINFEAENSNKISSGSQNINNYSIQTYQNVKNDFEKSPKQDEFDNSKKTKKIVGIIASVIAAAALIIGGICWHKGKPANGGEEKKFFDRLKDGWKELTGKGKKAAEDGSGKADNAANEAGKKTETAADEAKNKAEAAPKEEAVEAPKEEVVEAPKEEAVEAPKEETVEAPKEETVEVPKEEAVEAPKEEAVEVPKEETVEVPKEETVEVPKEETVEVPKEEVAEISEEAILPEIEEIEPEWIKMLNTSENPRSYIFKDKGDAVSFTEGYSKAKELDPETGWLVDTKLNVIDEEKGIANLCKSYLDNNGRLRKHVWSNYNSTDTGMEIIYDRKGHAIKTINYCKDGSKSIKKNYFRIFVDKLTSLFKS